MEECMPWKARTVKQGWLLKRGQHIKNWRERFFVLLDNGLLLGYKCRPENLKAFNNPLNKFQVNHCKINDDQTKTSNLNVFVLSRLNNSETLDRMFAVKSNNDKLEWIKAIEAVQTNLTSSSESLRLLMTSDRQRKRSLNDFELLCVLGKGTFGKVILSKDKITGKPCALKVLKKEMVISRDEIVHTMNENHVLRRSKHPFITDLLYAFTTAEYLCFAMEYVGGGELFYHLSRAGHFEIGQAKFYMAEIACALGYLHSNQVIYRDLKLENVLLDFEGHLRLVDFGLCNVGCSATDTFCGTPEYIAPEVIRAEKYTKAVDWWSLGVVSYEMLEGRLPFSSPTGVLETSGNQLVNDHALNLFNRIAYSPVPETMVVKDEVTKSILRGLLCKWPEKRLGGGIDDYLELERHPFFRQPAPQPTFDDYEQKRVAPPFQPLLQSQSDTSYFEAEFTSEPARLTLTSPDTKTLTHQNCFDKFTYLGSESSLIHPSWGNAPLNQDFIDNLFNYSDTSNESVTSATISEEPENKIRKIEWRKHSDGDLTLSSG